MKLKFLIISLSLISEAHSKSFSEVFLESIAKAAAESQARKQGSSYSANYNLNENYFVGYNATYSNNENSNNEFVDARTGRVIYFYRPLDNIVHGKRKVGSGFFLDKLNRITSSQELYDYEVFNRSDSLSGLNLKGYIDREAEYCINYFALLMDNDIDISFPNDDYPNPSQSYVFGRSKNPYEFFKVFDNEYAAFLNKKTGSISFEKLSDIFSLDTEPYKTFHKNLSSLTGLDKAVVISDFKSKNIDKYFLNCYSTIKGEALKKSPIVDFNKSYKYLSDAGVKARFDKIEKRIKLEKSFERTKNLSVKQELLKSAVAEGLMSEDAAAQILESKFNNTSEGK